MVTKEEIEAMTKGVEDSVKSILDGAKPMRGAMQNVIDQFTPKETRIFFLNGEQVTVGILPGNRILLSFHEQSGVNAYIYSSSKKRGKIANLLYAIRCLFT